MSVSPIPVRRRMTGEKPFVGLVDEVGPAALREALIAEGIAATRAGELAWFIYDQARGVRHPRSPNTLSSWRKALAGLDAEEVAARARAIGGYVNSPRLRPCA